MVAKLGLPLSVLQSRLTGYYPAGTYQIILLKEEGSSGRSVFTLAPSNVNTSTNEITITGSTFLVDTPVKFQGADVPAPFDTTSTFWVKSKVSNAHTFSATKGGATIDITDQGSGTFTIQDEELDFAIDPQMSIAQIVRKEINYQGLTNRPTLTAPGSAAIDAANNRVSFALITVLLDNTSGAGLIEFDKYAIISGGSTTPGNTTGTLKAIYSTGGIAQINAGSDRNLEIALGEGNRAL